jgi:hypothetical protein
MDHIDYHIFKYRGSDIINLIKKKLAHCDALVESFVLSKSHNTKIKSIIDYIYIINYYYSMAGLMQLVMGQKEWIKIDNMIETHMNNFYLNNNVSTILSKLKKVLTNTEHINLCTKLIKKSNEMKTLQTISKKIRQHVNAIQCCVEKSVLIDIPDNIKILLPPIVAQHIDISKCLQVNRSSYFYIQKKTRDSHVREYIEKKYMGKSIECFNQFAQLLRCRHSYAKSMGFDNFFQYKRQSMGADSNDVTFLITDLMTKIDNRVRKEIDRIYRELLKDGQNKKVDMNDIIYYHEKLKSKNKFAPLKVLAIIFELCEQYFNIRFKKITEYQSLWCPTVSNYDIYYDNNICGHIYFDLLSRQSKSVLTTTYISLSHAYKNDDTQQISYSRGVLIGSYEDLEDPCISYAEVVILFKEIGHAIQNMLLNTTIGTHGINNDFDNIMAQVMEFMAWDNTYIQKICNDISTSSTLVGHILFTKYIDYGITIKLKCLNALFDHIVHNSPSIINMINDESEGNEKGDILCNLYKKLYKDIMSPFSDILNINIVHVNPNILIQETNGNEALLYTNLLNEILSHTVFQAIKKGNGNKFIEKVIRIRATTIRNLIHEFIAELNIDSYAIYLKNIIGYCEVDTELNNDEKEKYIDDMTDDTNYFDDATDDEQNNNQLPSNNRLAV